jgi:hypothetical protein
MEEAVRQIRHSRSHQLQFSGREPARLSISWFSDGHHAPRRGDMAKN